VAQKLVHAVELAQTPPRIIEVALLTSTVAIGAVDTERRCMVVRAR
jgi:hypothetical protein